MLVSLFRYNYNVLRRFVGNTPRIGSAIRHMTSDALVGLGFVRLSIKLYTAWRKVLMIHLR